MQDRYSILIDGGFAKHKLGSKKQPATATEIQSLIAKIQEQPDIGPSKLHRVYYYDAVPYAKKAVKPLNGGKVDFSNEDIVRRSTKLFAELAKTPYVALRMGELTLNGWKVSPQVLAPKTEDNKIVESVTITKEHLRPNIQQKGVDMRIGMDIAALSLKKIVQSIVLVTGDSDLVPAMKFARREGLQVYLVTLGHHVLPSMIEHADVLMDLQMPKKTA